MKGHEMGVRAMQWAWRAQVTPTCKLVLIALADRADDDGICWPSVEDITTRTGLAERTVRRDLGTLADLGLIVRDRRNGQSNMFRMTFEDAKEGEIVADEGCTECQGGAPHAPRGVHHMHLGGAPHAPLTINRTTKVESSLSIMSLPAKKGGNVASGTRLPPDWWPTSDGVDFAERMGLNVSAIADQFRDYWHGVPGAKGRKADWPATWRNWCRRNAERQTQNRPRKTSQWTTAEQDAEVRRLVAQHSQPQLRIVK